MDVVDAAHHHDRIANLSLSGDAVLYERADTAVRTADLIILGPGDLYTSILANCVVPGMREALMASGAKIVYVANLMARSGQTIDMHVPEYIAEITKYAGVRPHVVMAPDAELPTELIERYKREEQVHPVNCEGDIDGVRVCRRPIASHTIVARVAGDTLPRSFIRHDSDALAAAVVELLHTS
jgi:uncharacterized cofD-like protein